MRVALVEPYYGGSHQAWADGYRRHSAHDVVLLSHPARFWKWRMQGSYVTLGRQFLDAVEQSGQFDVVLASGMLHLPGFLGVIGEARGGAAVALYMHENQLTYPLSEQDRPDDAYAMINWASTVVADVTFFNSEFHRSVWFDALPRLLRRFPDHQHTDFVAEAQSRSEVLPVGIDLARLHGPRADDGRDPVILWNQRWEYDKGPEDFAMAMRCLTDGGAAFRVVMTGERFVGQPAEFEALPGLLGERLIHSGHVDDDRYCRLLLGADIVVSTARQEFFGVAITEAVYAGAFPLVPDRLVYPERIPARFHEHCLYTSVDDLVAKLESVIGSDPDRAAIASELRPVMAKYDWSVVAPRYDRALELLV